MLKKKHFFLVVAAVTTLFTGCGSFGGISTDGSSEEKTVAATSAAILDILDALDYDNVVGVPETEKAIPDRYAEIETIGAPMAPDVELLTALSPDVVLSPKTLESDFSESYTNAGLNSAFLDLSSVSAMYDGIESLGSYLDREEEAQALVSDYKTKIEQYEETQAEDISVLILMAFPDGFYLVANETSYVGDLVSIAGGTNVYPSSDAEDDYGFVSVNPEDMVQTEPDVILVFAHYSEEDAFSYMEEEFQSKEAWQYYEAVTSGNVYYLPSEIFGMSADLNWSEGVDYLQKIFTGGQE
ncbi:MAG: ABC transporter substrate-binding protein [Lachnospiraceae bacterium]|nr:ABC transporter substrate-binding protein [Lachnospiraceae bacterium]